MNRKRLVDMSKPVVFEMARCHLAGLIFENLQHEKISDDQRFREDGRTARHELRRRVDPLQLEGWTDFYVKMMTFAGHWNYEHELPRRGLTSEEFEGIANGSYVRSMDERDFHKASTRMPFEDKVKLFGRVFGPTFWDTIGYPIVHSGLPGYSERG